MWAPASAWLHGASIVARGAVVTLARHSGVPAVVVAAVALVVAFRIARRATHLAIEFALALALVVAATRAGWLRF
jgi:hypothetical protein